MKERARELKAEKAGSDGEQDVLEKIDEMAEPDRVLARRLHAIVRETAPVLTPRTWYGMPAYALDGKVLCFFQAAGKFKTRYATFGFGDHAKLDRGPMWPTGFALLELTGEVESEIRALLERAVG